MGLFKWLKLKRKDFRQDARTQVREGVHCSIQIDKSSEFHKVWICDVSRTGIGFLIRKAEAETGQAVTAHFLQEQLQIGYSTGQIVGQDVVYYGPDKEMEKAFFRFSVRFDLPLADDILNRLQNLQ